MSGDGALGEGFPSMTPADGLDAVSLSLLEEGINKTGVNISMPEPQVLEILS